MKFKTLGAVVLTSAIGLGLAGCFKGDGYTLSQQDVDAIAKIPTNVFVSASNKRIEVYKLLKEQRYQEAEDLLETYLRDQLDNAQYCKVDDLQYVSKQTKDYVSKTVDEQTKKIEDCLNKNN